MLFGNHTIINNYSFWCNISFVSQFPVYIRVIIIILRGQFFHNHSYPYSFAPGSRPQSVMSRKILSGILLLALVCVSFTSISSFHSKSLLEAQQYDVEAIAIVNKLKLIIDQRDKSTTTNIRIVTMLDVRQNYRLNGVLMRLLAPDIDFVSWTIHQDSQNVQQAIINMMQYETIFIFFAETVSTPKGFATYAINCIFHVSSTASGTGFWDPRKDKFHVINIRVHNCSNSIQLWSAKSETSHWSVLD